MLIKHPSVTSAIAVKPVTKKPKIKSVVVRSSSQTEQDVETDVIITSSPTLDHDIGAEPDIEILEQLLPSCSPSKVEKIEEQDDEPMILDELTGMLITSSSYMEKQNKTKEVGTQTSTKVCTDFSCQVNQLFTLELL
ncbi:hypothetical protein SNE40_022158 [Patella caerulea]|uniref:Uncharacterized protein n=1 Tax=Patella caerulea TaxID=87958 RepID=A0AAN8GAD2_PATCE